MNVLLVYAHPVPDSFNASVFDTVKAALKTDAHSLRITDLYAENFLPVLSREDREAYLDNTEQLVEKVSDHVQNLKWAEALIFVFPTWYYGPPAILKGWFERVWLPGVTFNVAEEKGQITSSCMRHIKCLMVITTSGAPRWWMFIVGNPCKRFFMRGMRALFAKRCKTTWMQLYEMNVIDEAARKKFLKNVARKVAAL